MARIRTIKNLHDIVQVFLNPFLIVQLFLECMRGEIKYFSEFRADIYPWVN